MQTNNLNHFKSVVAFQFFVEPADNDYLVSRWMLICGFQEAFWHISQALEKYMKAGLILNGANVESIAHDLEAIHKNYVNTFHELSPAYFCRPDDLSENYWHEEAVSHFVRRIARIGNPDSRYGLTSWWRKKDDLFKVDQLCWHLRRLTIGLDWEVGRDFPCDPSLSQFVGNTYNHALSVSALTLPRGILSNLERVMPTTGSQRADLLHAWNFSFTRNKADLSEPAPRTITPEVPVAQNSYLSLFWEELNMRDERMNLLEIDGTFRKGMEWLISHIKLPRGIKPEIQKLLDAPPDQETGLSIGNFLTDIVGDSDLLAPLPPSPAPPRPAKVSLNRNRSDRA